MSALVAPPATPFLATVHALDDATLARMRGRSWRPDPRCPAPAALRRIEARHADFAGRATIGELVVAAEVAAATVALLARLYAIGFPIRRLHLIDDHDGDDDASMAADNSSAFNFRTVAGTELLSQHAFGRALDLNPVENPWITSRGLAPAAGEAYRDRTRVRPGMIVRPGPVTAILDELGWEWGGDWRHARDYHHVVAPAR